MLVFGENISPIAPNVVSNTFSLINIKILFLNKIIATILHEPDQTAFDIKS